MRFNMARGPGLSSLLKSGYKTMSGVEDAVVKNIEACAALSQITRTSLGPNGTFLAGVTVSWLLTDVFPVVPTGMCKLVINHLEKVFITSDAATIVGELEIEHPAAKMLTMAAKQQETEVGDGTNFVVTFTGELLNNARDLLRMVCFTHCHCVATRREFLMDALKIRVCTRVMWCSASRWPRRRLSS